MLCEQAAAENTPAPVAGCHCYMCVRSRESYVDPRLVALSSRRCSRSGKMETSRYIVDQGIDRYLSGHIPWESLHVSIIEALAKNLDAVTEASLAIQRMSPASSFFVPTPKGEEP
jgi:hypothetical protein